MGVVIDEPPGNTDRGLISGVHTGRQGVSASVRISVFHSGERFPILIGASGLPLSLPTRYTVDRLRDHYKTNTIAKKMRVIQWFYEWATQLEGGFDPEIRLRSHQLLTRDEVRSFETYLRACRTAVIGVLTPRNIIPGARLGVLSNDVFNDYLRDLRAFLVWCAQTQVQPEISPKAISSLERRFTLLPRTTRPYHYGLDDARQAKLLAIVAPDSPANPFKRPSRIRNALIIRLLIETGVRRGELCKLRVSDLNTIGGDDPYIEVNRRPDDPMDPRRNEPQVKTRPRRIPIGAELKAQLVQYLRLGRGRCRHPYLFTVPSRNGSCLAYSPLGLAGINAIFRRVREVFPEFDSVKITPHSLRRTFNDNFLRLAEASKCDEIKAATVQNYLNGWTDGSRQAVVYTRRVIEQRAFELLGGLHRKNSELASSARTPLG